jgi:hypothetical protein
VNGTLFIVSFGLAVCFSAAALGQAGAPTQRVHIPGIPDGTSIYPKPTDHGDNFVSIGCVAKYPNGEFRITDWRGGERPPVAGAPPFAARAPLVFRLQGDREMLNFQADHRAHRGKSGCVSPAGNQGRIDFVPLPKLLEKGNYDGRIHGPETMMKWCSIRMEDLNASFQ